MLHQGSPRVPTQSKRQILTGRRACLVSTCDGIPIALAELRKAKAVEFIGVWEGSFVSMSGTGRDGDERACGNSHAIGKCEWLQRETVRRHWGGRGAHISSS
jgi:hypothetical protein